MIGNDLRAFALGAVAWAAALVGLLSPRVGWLLGVSVVVVVLWALGPGQGRLRDPRMVTGVGWALAAAAVLASTLLQAEPVRHGLVPALATAGASVSGEIVVTSDPVRRTGRFGDQVRFRASLRTVTFRGRAYALRAPVSVRAGSDWADVPFGSRVAVTGLLSPAGAFPADVSAQLAVRGPPRIRNGPGLADRAAGRVRAAIRDAVARLPAEPRALLPALVDGSDGGLSAGVRSDFTVSGLTHLLAVSGTNLTLILGFGLTIARLLGVRARGLLVVGLLGVVGFVLLARAEPSVLRAAVMGAVALLGMGSNGRERGLRALGIAVLVLLSVEPWLALSAGFALSACATAGIVWLAPGWRDSLGRWLPRWAAEAIAVPLAAQLVCTPLVAAISGQVSVVAVGANVVAAPLVGPATVLTLIGGLLALIVAPLGQAVVIPAGWCGAGLIGIARRAASLPGAVIGWSSRGIALILLVCLCVLLGWTLRSVLARRGWVLGLAAATCLVLVVPLPVPGWPPRGWVMVACSIGQGDGLVLNLGGHAGVVVDAGPDPALIDQCLRRLEITAVPIVVLTHFHADHVDGLAGVLRGRRIGEILTSPLEDPPGGSRAVRALAERAGIPLRGVQYGETTRVGPISWQVLAPIRTGYVDSDSPPNDASVVLLVRSAGLSLLLMGDEERPSQADLARDWPNLRADVLKVAHHGSSKQDVDLVTGVGARLAVISVGLGNDYGHPAPATMALLRRTGMRVLRTDLDGDVAVASDGAGGVSTATHPVTIRPP